MKKIFVVALALLLALGAQAAGPRVLFLSKSAGFQHSTITSKDGKPSHTDTQLTEIVGGLGGTITCTKDASLVSKDNLKNYDVVIFYTTGDLTTPGTDGQKPMAATGVAELTEWIQGGGGFMGFHCASDTFHPDPQCGPPSAYGKLIGGEFTTHGGQFAGILKTVSPGHPLVANVPADWKIADEWYVLCNYNKENIHVLELLDPGDERAKQEKYNIPAYPIAWCSAQGKGRVYYNAQGHREDVWSNPQFHTVVGDAITWCSGKGELKAEPNYDKVVTAEPKK